MTWGVGLAVFFLAMGVFLPWKGVHFPDSLGWLWIPVVVGVVVVYLPPRRLFPLWFGLGLVVLAVALSWTVRTRLFPVIVMFVAGVVIGLTVRAVMDGRTSGKSNSHRTVGT